MKYEWLVVSRDDSVSVVIVVDRECMVESCLWWAEKMKDGSLQLVFLDYEWR